MKFSYKAKRDAGTEATGVMEASDFSGAVRRLKQMGLYPLEVVPLQGKEVQTAHSKSKSLSRAELSLWARSVGDGLGAGMSLTQALHLVVEQEKDRPAGKAAALLEEKVLSGESMAEAMEKMNPVFPPIAAHLARAGEESGSLEQVLRGLASEAESEAEMVEKIRGALVYPLFVMAVGIATAAAVVWIVFPKLQVLFTQTGQPLPWTIKFFSAVSKLAIWLLAAAVPAAFFIPKEWAKRAGRAATRLPVVGPFLKTAELSRFCATAGLLLDHGLSLPETLRLCSELVKNDTLKNAARRSLQDVMEGFPLSQSLRRSGLQEPYLLTVLGVGEAQGDLALAFKRAAARYQREVDRHVKIFSALIEPVLILGVGLFVAAVVFSVMLPVFDLNFAIK